MKPRSRWRQKLTPIRVLVAGYALVVLVIAALLCLPAASANGECQSFIDAFFMACSGVSTTGLVVVDIGKSYSLFGQIVLLADFQIGGIGYMTFIVYAMYLLGARLRMGHRQVAYESMASPLFGGLLPFFRLVVTGTLLVEFIGAVVLTCCWLPQFSLGRAAYLGMFHSISAFCTAGFSVFSDSLMSYRMNPVVNLTISLVSLAGGIGFLVLVEIRDACVEAVNRKHLRRLSVHSKLALVVTAAVVLLGTAVIFVSEKWPASWSFGQRMMASGFQAVSASTTDGFNTIDIGAMSATSLFAVMLLMFIGASPGSTGGGIKTTTLGVLLASLWAELRTRPANLFRRRIPDEILKKAYAIAFCSVLIVVFDSLLLMATENASPVQVLFEVVSALGNTGLSTGITPSLSALGKILLAVTMFAGRVGPLALGVALMAKPEPASYRYADADVFVG